MRIEFDTGRALLTVEGVHISLDVLLTLTRPDPEVFYRFARDGRTVIAKSYHETPLRNHKDCIAIMGPPV
jgi:hypothetical protein